MKYPVINLISAYPLLLYLYVDNRIIQQEPLEENEGRIRIPYDLQLDQVSYAHGKYYKYVTNPHLMIYNVQDQKTKQSKLSVYQYLSAQQLKLLLNFLSSKNILQGRRTDQNAASSDAAGTTIFVFSVRAYLKETSMNGQMGYTIDFDRIMEGEKQMQTGSPRMQQLATHSAIQRVRELQRKEIFSEPPESPFSYSSNQANTMTVLNSVQERLTSLEQEGISLFRADQRIQEIENFDQDAEQDEPF